MKTIELLDLRWNNIGEKGAESIAKLARKLKTDGFERILWFNMREEPVVYLNGTASAPRGCGGGVDTRQRFAVLGVLLLGGGGGPWEQEGASWVAVLHGRVRPRGQSPPLGS